MNKIGITPMVTAVVVTYQSAGTIEATLSALGRCNDSGVLSCIFVDNGSKDDTPQKLLSVSDWAEIILTGQNNGFGRGCNIGLSKVKSPYTLYLNPDAQIEPEAVQVMVDFMEANPMVGIIGPATFCGAVDESKTYQHTSSLPTPWDVLRSATPFLQRSDASRPIVPGGAPFLTGWVCGAVFMIRTKLAMHLAGFDPRFFLYWEETDICRRAAALGFETWAVGAAVASHVCGASSSEDNMRVSGCIAKYYYQSRRYYMIKHHGWVAATVADIGEFVLLCMLTLADIMRGRGGARLQKRLQASLLSLPEKV